MEIIFALSPGNIHLVIQHQERQPDHNHCIPNDDDEDDHHYDDDDDEN